MQIKTTPRFHLTPVRIAIIKSNNNRCWRRCGEKGTLVYCWWNASYYNHSGKQYGGFLKN
jgi:hypothetical protein